MKYLSTILLCLVAIIGCSQPTEQKADSLMLKALPLNEHGLAVLVEKDGKVLYKKEKGFADMENKRMVDANTVFRIGSVTKQFTATAILKLSEMGKLELNDPLTKFVPDFPDGDKVTIHHLLTHTSGIKSYTDQSDFMDKVTNAIKLKNLIEEIKGLGYDFEPGAQWRYNNSGYMLLEFIIETTSGSSYEKFLQKNLFNPAGMKNTGIYKNKSSYKNEALGYSMDKGIKRSIDWDMTWAGAAGNIYSTTEDLLKWNKTVFGHKIISKESLKKAHTPVKLNDGSTNPYGYGWSMSEFKEQKRIGHSGGLHGFLSYLVYYPEIDASVAVLSNCMPPKNVNPANFAEKLTDIFFEEHLKQNMTVKVDTDLYDKYLGKYEYPGGAVMTVTRDGDHLMAKISGQATYELFPKGDHQFFWKVVDAEVRFVLDDKGLVTHGMHKQGGMEMKVPRLAEKMEVKLADGAFNDFAGDYDLSGRNVKVWEEEGKYLTQIEGQPSFEIFPESDHEFFMKEMAVKLEFLKENGVTNGFILHQAGQQITVKKK